MGYFLSSSFYHPVALQTGHLTWNQALFSLHKNFPFVLLVFIMWTQQGWFFKLPWEQFVKWNASRRKLDIIWPMCRHLSAVELNAGLGSSRLVLLPYHCQHTDKCNSLEKWRLYQWTNNCRATIDLTSHLTWDKRVQ